VRFPLQRNRLQRNGERRSIEQVIGAAMEGGITPKVLASTGAKFSCSIAESRRREKDSASKENEQGVPILNPDDLEGDVTNYFKSIQWYHLHSLSFHPPVLKYHF
jgi:hypothetical protein